MRSNGSRKSRRLAAIVAVLATFVFGLPHSSGAQPQTRTVHGGIVTLESGGFFDFRLTSMDQFSLLLDGLLFDAPLNEEFPFTTLTTHNGASRDTYTSFREHPEDGIFWGGYWDVFTAPTSNPNVWLGFVRPDPQDGIIVSPSCDPLPPSFVEDFFVPPIAHYGHPLFGLDFYFDTCAPGSYVDITFQLRGARFADAVAPEPTTLVLTASGLVTISAVARRRRRLRS